MRRLGLQRLIALVLSLLLWAFVRYTKPGGGVALQKLAELTLNVPIQINHYPPNLIPYSISDQEVRVTLQGDATAVGKVRDSYVQAYVDLTGQDSPTVLAEVKVLAPGGLTTVDADPKQVTVKLSPSANSPVPVKVMVSGSPATGLSAGEVRMEPKTVRVTGPQALVDDVKEVVAKVALDGQSQDYTVELHDLVPLNSQGMEVLAKIPGRGIKILPDAVSATIPILSDNRTVAVAVSLNQLRITPAHGWTYRLEVEPEFVTLRVGRHQKPPKFLTTKAQNINVSTKVDSRELDLVIPDGVEVVGSSSVTLKVIPERQDITDSVNTTEPVTTPSPAPSSLDKRDS